MKQCLECGTFSADNAMYCTICGRRFPEKMDVLAAENIKRENIDERDLAEWQKHPEIISLLQRIVLFLEDEEFDRADEYCERILDIEPTNAEAYIDKLLVEFKCTTREQLKHCTASIANSKNYAKVVRFGDEKQKAFVVEAEKAIREYIAGMTEKTPEKATWENSITEKAKSELGHWKKEFDETEECYIDIICPYCQEELSYTDWQIKGGELTCPMCNAHFVFDEAMEI